MAVQEFEKNVFDKPEVDNSSERDSRGRIHKVARYLGAAVAGGAVIAGSYLMFRNNNMDDFMDLKAFTSPEHQQDRCNTQSAFDAQVKMREHFEAKGGITDEEADFMAPVVGLEPGEIKSLLGNKLYPMDYDCEQETASSQEATIGAFIAAIGVGAGVGAAVTGLTRKRQ